MRTGIEQKQAHARSGRTCRHHWVIETPHGATSRGHCKLCGISKRFPNAPEHATWESGSLGRWAARRGVARPAEIRNTGKKS